MPRGIPNKSTSFLKVETDVKAPPPISKYVELEIAVLDVPLAGRDASEWMRFLFAEKKLATNARQYLFKRNKVWTTEGHEVETKVVPDGTGPEVWLYVRRVTIKKKEVVTAN